MTKITGELIAAVGGPNRTEASPRRDSKAFFVGVVVLVVLFVFITKGRGGGGGSSNDGSNDNPDPFS